MIYVLGSCFLSTEALIVWLCKQIYVPTAWVIHLLPPPPPLRFFLAFIKWHLLIQRARLAELHLSFPPDCEGVLPLFEVIEQKVTSWVQQTIFKCVRACVCVVPKGESGGSLTNKEIPDAEEFVFIGNSVCFRERRGHENSGKKTHTTNNIHSYILSCYWTTYLLLPESRDCILKC